MFNIKAFSDKVIPINIPVIKFIQRITAVKQQAYQSDTGDPCPPVVISSFGDVENEKTEKRR